MKNKAQILFYGILVTLLVVVMATFFVGGFSSIFTTSQDYAKKIIEIKTNDLGGVVYIDGAVFNAGYYSFKNGDTYDDLLKRAGLIQNVSHVDVNLQKVVPISITRFYVNFWYFDNLSYVLNVNNPLFVDLSEQIGIDEITAKKISDFVKTNGKISTKSQLKQVLTSLEWESVYFKLYVEV